MAHSGCSVFKLPSISSDTPSRIAVHWPARVMIEPITENTNAASSLVAQQLALATSFARLAGVTSAAASITSPPPGAPPSGDPIPSAPTLLRMDDKAQALAVNFYAARLIQSDMAVQLGALSSTHIDLLA
jgi:hypothetical protein